MAKKTILIVDDSGLVRLVVRDELTKLGYATETASNSAKAFKLCKEKKPDLILLDVMLPGLDGFETCRQLKSDPQTKDIPVIFMTAKDHPEDVQSGKKAGGNGYLVKPFESEELQKTISGLIGKSDYW